MFLYLIEWQSEGAGADVSPVPPDLLASASQVRFFKIKGVIANRMIWAEFDAKPDVQLLPKAKVTLLEQTNSIGQAGPLETPHVYLVHSDIEPELLDEYHHGSGVEHLQRLVKVPGILRARRFTALAGAPLFLTAYDLTDRHAFESPAGLEARKTAWTNLMNSQARVTRRIMCRL